MKKITLLIMLFLTASVFTATAQDRTITGTVSDASENDAPLPGVAIVVNGTTIGTITDIEGKYSLKVPDGYEKLLFSFIGYKPQTVTIGAASVIDLALEADNLMIEEVVVTALGISRAKKGLGYAVQEVEGDDLSQSGKPNVVTALQGKIAGVQVNQADGTPGGGSSIKIRGINSFGWGASNQPLFVIDGVPIDNSYQESGNPDNLQNNLLDGVSMSNRAVDINPNDIENVSVLKGAAAAALYGLRASNGVILITTKKGKRNSKVRVSIGSDVSMEKVARLPDLQTKYAQGSDGNYSNNTSMSWGPDVSTLDEIVNAAGETVSAQIYDNVGNYFETGMQVNNSINVSGGNELADFYLSFSNHSHNGIMPTSDFKRRTVSLSGNLDVARNLTIGSSINYVNSGGNRVQKGSNLANPLFTVYPSPITFDLHGLPFETADDPYTQIHYRTRFDNPHWSAKHNSFVDNVNRIYGNVRFEYKPLEWLSIKYVLGTDFYIDRRNQILSKGSGETGGRTSPPSGGRIAERSIFSQEINSDLLVTINKNIVEDLQATVIVGNNVNNQFSQDLYTQGDGIDIGGFNHMSNTQNQIVREQTQEKRIIGLFGDLQLAYKRMLYVGVSLRNDWPSTLPGQSFFYPGANLGFIFTEALGMTDNPILPYGKLRASWAQVGKDAEVYATATTYEPSQPGSGFLTDGIAFPFAGNNAFEFGNVIGNPSLVPQNETSWEVGLDLRFLDNRIGIDATYYNSKATNQIFLVPITATTGARNVFLNAGEITNKGVELTVNVTPVNIKNTFRWDVHFNFTRNRGKIIELAEGVDAVTLSGFTSIGTRLVPGEAPTVLWGTPFLRDDAGNVVLDDRATIGGNANPYYGMPIGAPQQGIIGNTQADWIGGFGTTLTWKALTLAMHFTTRQGGERYAGNTSLLKLYGRDALTEDRESVVVLDGVKGHLDPLTNELVSTGQTNDIAITRGQDFWRDANNAIDEADVYDASFLRLSEVSLTYDFANLLGSNRALSGLEVFVRANNVFLITDYPNFDPETNLGGANANFEGFEYMNLPTTRRVGGGVRLNF